MNLELIRLGYEMDGWIVPQIPYYMNLELVRLGYEMVGWMVPQIPYQSS